MPCRSSPTLPLPTGPARGARTNSPWFAAPVVLVCTAATPADSELMNTVTDSNTNARSGHCRHRPVEKRGAARATSAASPGWCPGTVRSMRCVHRSVPKAVDARRCVVCWQRRLPVGTSTPCIQGRVRPVSPSQHRIHCASASSRPTNSLAFGQCSTRSESTESTKPKASAGSSRTILSPPRSGRTSRVA